MRQLVFTVTTPGNCLQQQSWLLVQTRSNAERHAQASLTAPYRGATVYLPLMLITIVHARRKREVERPFLPRYLFVLDDGVSLPAIRTAPGVSGFAKRGDAPILVPQHVIDKIKQREQRGYVDLDERPAPLVKYRAGEIVRVSDGPFASFNGIFSKWTHDEHRAAILIDVFGRKVPVELEPGQFEKC